MFIDLQGVFTFILLGAMSWAVFYLIAKIDTWIGDRKYNRIKK